MELDGNNDFIIGLGLAILFAAISLCGYIALENADACLEETNSSMHCVIMNNSGPNPLVFLLLSSILSVSTLIILVMIINMKINGGKNGR